MIFLHINKKNARFNRAFFLKIYHLNQSKVKEIIYNGIMKLVTGSFYQKYFDKITNLSNIYRLL